jgi:hypothetical protein
MYKVTFLACVGTFGRRRDNIIKETICLTGIVSVGGDKSFYQDHAWVPRNKHLKHLTPGQFVLLEANAYHYKNWRYEFKRVRVLKL